MEAECYAVIDLPLPFASHLITILAGTFLLLEGCEREVLVRVR